MPCCGKKVIVWLRSDISCGLRDDSDSDNIEVIECCVDVLEPTGPNTLMFVGNNDTKVTSQVHPDKVKPVGDIKHLDINVSRNHFFDTETEMRIN